MMFKTRIFQLHSTECIVNAIKSVDRMPVSRGDVLKNVSLPSFKDWVRKQCYRKRFLPYIVKYSHLMLCILNLKNINQAQIRHFRQSKPHI